MDQFHLTMACTWRVERTEWLWEKEERFLGGGKLLKMLKYAQLSASTKGAQARGQTHASSK
jgi:hypothetical protein